MALATMRRHRRWLYVFLWIVILGFIVFYIPAFWQGVGRGESRRGPRHRRRREDHGRRVPEGLHAPARRSTSACTRADDPGHAAPPRPRGAGPREASWRRGSWPSRRSGSACRSTRDASPGPSTTAPEFQENGRFMGAGGDQAAARVQGMSPAEFEEELRGRLLRDQLEALVTRRRGGLARRGGAGVPPPQRAGRRSSTSQVDAAPLPGRGRGDRGRGEGPLREGERAPTAFPSSACSPTCSSTRTRSAAAGHGHRRRPRGLLPASTATSSSRRSRSAPATSWSRSRPRRRRRRATPKRRHRPIAQALLAQVKGGRRLRRARAKKSSEDQGSADARRRPRLLPRGAHGAGVRRTRRSPRPGQTSELVKTNFGYHIIRLTSSREEQVPPLVAVKERIRPRWSPPRRRRSSSTSRWARPGGAARRQPRGRRQGASGSGVEERPPSRWRRRRSRLSSPALAARAFELKAGETGPRRLSGAPRPRVLPRGRGAARAGRELKEVQDKVKAELSRRRRSPGPRRRPKRSARGPNAGPREGRGGLEARAQGDPGAWWAGASPWASWATSAARGRGGLRPPREVAVRARAHARGYAILRVLERKAFDPAAFAEPEGGGRRARCASRSGASSSRPT